MTPVTSIEGALRDALPAAAFRELEPRYLEEPRGRYKGQGGLLVAPATTEEVSMAVKLAYEAGVPVVPYGGGTGLVGGQIAHDGIEPLIISLERMNAVRAIYPEENVLVAEAGCILQDLHTAVEKENRLFPLSIAAKGSARIGGNLATNAGGLNVLRYGNARDLCLGLEVVMPNGDVWNGLTRLRKDNTGYDLRNLMIGSEGSLGIITAAALKLFPLPASEGTALFVVPSPEAATELLAMARSHMAEGISAFEIMHRQGWEFLQETMPELRLPYDEAPEWSILTDVGLAKGLDPAEALEALFAEAFEAGIVTDGLIAQSEQQRIDLWNIRENIPEANRRIGSISSHDISVPISRIPEFIREGNAAMAALEDVRVNCFGHLGDGNLHYNVFPAAGKSRADYEDLRTAVKTGVHDLVHAYNGSVSAEHGVGRLKVSDLEKYSDPVKLAALRAIKQALDPKGIMNPGVILRA